MVNTLKSVIGESDCGEVTGDTLNEETFTANGTFTVPTGFKGFVFVTLAGGGGAGGEDNGSLNGGAGGGGGAVFYRWPIWLDKAVDSTVSVTIGNGGSITSGDGNQGGNTSFGTFLTAYGGGGGAGAADPAQGGLGGTLDAKGESAAGPTGSSTDETYNLFPLELFPVYRNMRMGLYCEGAEGGSSNDGSSGQRGGDCLLSPASGSETDFYTLEYPFKAAGSNLFSVSYGGNGRTFDGEGGGGGSWGNGGDAGQPAPTNGGGGGAGEQKSSGSVQRAGAKGVCIVEYWT